MQLLSALVNIAGRLTAIILQAMIQVLFGLGRALCAAIAALWVSRKIDRRHAAGHHQASWRRSPRSRRRSRSRTAQFRKISSPHGFFRK